MGFRAEQDLLQPRWMEPAMSRDGARDTIDPSDGWHFGGRSRHSCRGSPYAGRRDRHGAEAPMRLHMNLGPGKRMIVAAACAAAFALAPSAHAEDFFSALFGA